MLKSTTASNMTDKNEIVYSSKYPISSILGLIIDMIAFTSFSYNMIFGELPFTYGLFYFILCFYLVDFILCPYAGKVIIYKNKISFLYFFPWNVNLEIDNDSIKEFDINNPRKRFFSTIYITTNKNETKKYNIQSWYGINGVDILKEKYNLIR